jgi:G3E family GTPase
MEVDKEVPLLVPAVVPVAPTPLTLPIPRVPVTILTGFLGAGKSTLLSRILSERHGWRVAVIMNELGPSSSVDKAQIFDRAKTVGEEWLEVENGCLCCTAKNETFLALESLLLRKPDIEHVIIEASGAADPAALVQRLWVDEALESRVVLDAVICVVDCSAVPKLMSANTLHYSVEAARQVAIADCILLNKTDLVSDEDISNSETILREINPMAQAYRTKFSDAPLEVVLRLGEYDAKIAKSKVDIDNLLERAARISISSHSSEIIRAFTIYLRRPIVLKTFEIFLFTLLWERRIGEYKVPEEDQILRIKGVLMLSTEEKAPRPYALQVVQDKYELEPFNHNIEACESAVIFIGRIDTSTEDIIKTAIMTL